MAPDRDCVHPNHGADDHDCAPFLPRVLEHRRAKPWETERDREVLRLCFAEWERLPGPKPDLPTWLNGASTALLLIRQVSS